ncbi:MAG: hypothetical protein A3G02_03125 [Candidatus Yanofskybacteria bacterium RIFCSPLOWO2_12_FULL_44_13b]|uniref:Type II secretion system protein GspF domain-containing protein n=2 Tax=Candidatus Yanofskyibacteriota TaxID=1752733 RepID=A0A1F8GZY3_9BACT|nr:MAG: Tfp pilus biogenesis protein PilC [Candidatus Yanofskybacteria bacterium GW2011_GWA2_44_10]KKT90018.1 MAG: Tfp pilus biogenesis protein PilC [Candidatus Yanofskybacteria bacterium GW2011_GWB1_45_11]OGN03609.1 MAG: hypothetical protein A2657_00305 [Candidatus Yanofskybacteria bacterium RIFCSPHIGHO2_01_FULL_44_110b]OGN14027.1 MAG: hypothetical protein A3C01_00170 [Candidatus Yanofskybacteria bacterium RIFCSPHIGHO2_02_FULL_44_36b]OGN18356.1 MAG: hypothetical protein A3F50_00435 [Candidatus
MPDFKYKARNQAGEMFDGIVSAPSIGVGVDILHNKGYVVFSINPVSKSAFSVDINNIFSRASNKDIVIFTRQLSTLIDADMPLAESLRTLAKQMEKPSLRNIISEVSESIEGGSSLSSALEAHPNLFNNFYVKLVKSGEVSGKLHDVLLYLADYLERSQSINSKIRGALAYPIFVIVALVLVSIVMATYVLPQLLSIFKETGAVDLPVTTRALIWITDFVAAYQWPMLVFFLAAISGIWWFLRTPAGKIKSDHLKIRIPILGKAIRNLYLSRIAESLATLIKSGIPILDALHITSDLVNNVNYRDILLKSEENVRGGGSISEIFSQYSDIPALLTSMIAIGEKTGKLDYMLQHVSKFYKSEAETAVDSIAQLIEPVLVLILGFGVAILVSSILLPIYNIVGSG